MKSLPERLNDRLERRTAWSWQGEEPPDRLLLPEHAPNRDPEVDELVSLALRLQSARPLQADPDFARQLEQRILVRNAALRLERPGSSWWFPRLLRVHPVFGLALSLCLLLLLGTGVLAVAAQGVEDRLRRMPSSSGVPSGFPEAIPSTPCSGGFRGQALGIGLHYAVYRGRCVRVR